jgi:hypothetical protein
MGCLSSSSLSSPLFSCACAEAPPWPSAPCSFPSAPSLPWLGSSSARPLPWRLHLPACPLPFFLPWPSYYAKQRQQLPWTAPRNSSRARPIFFPPWPKVPPAASSATMASSPGSELLPCFAVGRPCHYLTPSSRSELHRQPAQQAARCSSSHEIPSVSPASTRFAQRCRSTAAAPCCAVDLRGSTVSASRFAESTQRRRAIVGTRGETPLSCAFCVRLKGRTNESHNKLCNDCVCRLIAALVDVTPCASLVGKEPKLMAYMRGTSRPGCSPCMIAIYFTYVFGR